MLEPVPDQTLDIQHDTDPAPDHGHARRIPHLGHAFIFFSLTVVVDLSLLAGVVKVMHITTDEQMMQHVGMQLFIQAAAYVLILAAAAFLFTRLWSRPFLRGIEWNQLAARRHVLFVLAVGVVSSLAAQVADARLPQPKSLPLRGLLDTPAHAWTLTLLGIFLFPLFEEIAFRGFLLPALATAYDWLALDRTPAALRKWESSTTHTTPALIFAALFSSIAFALIHGAQLSFSWALLAVLFTVSLVFSWVRIRFHSVAASVLTHAIYNFMTFATALYATGFYSHLDKI